MKYDHANIEKKWQEKWDGPWRNLIAAEDFSSKPKCYLLVEFPYPSGEGLHLGHPRSYVAMDIVSRKRRMEGWNVLYPIGWDAFGLPAENYAIKTGQHPKVTTQKNIETFRRQLKSLGISFDWPREVDTTDPGYYKWTQWMFLQFFKHGLAYKAKMPINWCLSCKIGLANEEVVDGKCERCGGEIEKRDKEQWMIAITKYADRLLADLNTVNYLPKIRKQQEDWIGKSEGVNYKQRVKDLGVTFEVFDSVPQTFLAQTFAVIAPEHNLVPMLVKDMSQEHEVLAFVEKIKQKKAVNAFEIDKEIEGVFTGRYVENPFGTGDLPIWAASFAVADYGTGIVNCSAHDERDFAFAKKYGIPLRPVMFPADPIEAQKVRDLEYCYHHDAEGMLQEPAEFRGRKWGEARADLIAHIEKKNFGYSSVQYKLRDWVFSRQRYWGEPIPIIHCEKCGYVAVPDHELPVKLPEVEKYQPTDTGESPLAAITEWVDTTCPTCGGPAKRETDVMPNWAGSSWYFLRYIDPKNNKEFAAKDKLKYWMPVDWYNGGMEHTTLHLLYSRFWNKFLFDIGVAPTSEPYGRRTSHGLILGEDGEKMSKSRGNVINPDEIIKQHGADTLRCYEMFIGPFDQAVPWSSRGVVGIRRFLERVYGLLEKVEKSNLKPQTSNLTRIVHQTIKKVGDDIEAMKFNTAISQMMVCANAFADAEKISQELLELFVRVLSPFAPHLAEEMWKQLGHRESVMVSPWPIYNPELAKEQEIELVVQINGKVRDTLTVPAGLSDEELKARALASEKTKQWLVGKESQKVIVVKGKLVSIVV